MKTTKRAYPIVAAQGHHNPNGTATDTPTMIAGVIVNLLIPFDESGVLGGQLANNYVKFLYVLNSFKYQNLLIIDVIYYSGNF